MASGHPGTIFSIISAYLPCNLGCRFLTDVVFGNRHGMGTIRPAPLVLGKEPTGVVLVSACMVCDVGSIVA